MSNNGDNISVASSVESRFSDDESGSSTGDDCSSNLFNNLSANDQFILAYSTLEEREAHDAMLDAENTEDVESDCSPEPLVDTRRTRRFPDPRDDPDVREKDDHLKSLLNLPFPPLDALLDAADVSEKYHRALIHAARNHGRIQLWRSHVDLDYVYSTSCLHAYLGKMQLVHYLEPLESARGSLGATLLVLRNWLVGNVLDNPYNNRWAFQTFVEPDNCTPTVSGSYCDHISVATRNRGFLEYQALRRFLQQRDAVDGTQVDTLFQQHLLELEATHVLPFSNHLNTDMNDFTSDPEL